MKFPLGLETWPEKLVMVTVPPDTITLLQLPDANAAEGIVGVPLWTQRVPAVVNEPAIAVRFPDNVRALGNVLLPELVTLPVLIFPDPELNVNIAADPVPVELPLIPCRLPAPLVIRTLDAVRFPALILPVPRAIVAEPLLEEPTPVVSVHPVRLAPELPVP